MPANPFLTPSPLPLHYPDFDAIRDEHFRPAFEAGMAEQRAEVDAITSSPERPSFDNTMVALERSGAILRRVSAVFFTLVGSCSTPAIREIEAEVAPQLAAHEDAIMLDPALFARIEELLPLRPDLDEESARLLEHRHRDAVRAGARLAGEQQRRLRELNAELSALSTEFGNRLLAEANDSAVLVERLEQLDGLSQDAVSAAARAAAARGLDGYLLTLVLPTGQPALASLTDRELRMRLHTASVSRGARGNEHDARDLVLSISSRRAERARLLGHPHHASWVVEIATAGTVEAIDAVLGELAPIAATNARGEAEELAAAAGHEIEAWDRAFYAEQVRRERFDIDARRAAAVLRARPGAARRRVPRRGPALRAALRRAPTTCPATTPRCGSSTCSTRAVSSGSSSPISTPATPSAAARG